MAAEISVALGDEVEEDAGSSGGDERGDVDVFEPDVVVGAAVGDVDVDEDVVAVVSIGCCCGAVVG